LLLWTGTLIAQSKKKQIDIITNRADSLDHVLSDMNTKLNGTQNQLFNTVAQNRELIQENTLLKEQVKSMNTEFKQLNNEKAEWNGLKQILTKRIDSLNRAARVIISRYPPVTFLSIFKENEGIPKSKIILNFEGELAEITTITGTCEIISKDRFTSYQIPHDALAACMGWYAGAGDYFYVILRENIPVVYKGWQDEMQDSDGYHWEEMMSVYLEGMF